MNMHYNFIAIEGNIGSGKTTLATKLAKDLDARLMLEEFSNNPFLPKFYLEPEKHAFPLELFFMAERYRQFKREKDQDLFQPLCVSDYFFFKSYLFAQNNLKLDELQLFNRLFDIISLSVKSPDLVVYLYSDVTRLQENILIRGREFESNIPSEYLQNIQERYLDFLNKQQDFPVLILNVTKVDFNKDEIVYNSIKELVLGKYNLGVHYFELS
tara:strand:- start:1440 stop:2078 length:639 start_codon:yes stop_codon:yes gene_type:complete